jgi:hypothetical protein
MKDLREAVRLRRAGWTYPRIGRLLGRTAASVRKAVPRAAPDLRTPRPALAALEARLRDLHARGHPDREVARRLGLHHATATSWRKRLGLADNRHSPRRRAWYGRHARAVAHKFGKPHLRAVQEEVYRLRAAGAGWPDAISPQEVEVLDLLADRGPLSGAEVEAARGVRRHTTWRLMSGLIGRGLVVRQDRGREGGGRAPSLYRLADGVGRHQTHVCHRVRGEEGVGS